MRTCCFCIDLETAARAVALTEVVLAVPCIVSGVASLSVPSLATGMLLFVSAWVLFDGVFLNRGSIINGWLVITVGKVLVCLIAGSLCVLVAWDAEYILGQLNIRDAEAIVDDSNNATTIIKKSKFLYNIKSLAMTYLLTINSISALMKEPRKSRRRSGGSIRTKLLPY